MVHTYEIQIFSKSPIMNVYYPDQPALLYSSRSRTSPALTGVAQLVGGHPTK